MKFGIRTKLFLTFLLANFLLAGSFMSVNSWLQGRAFLKYVNESENQKLKPLSDAISLYYQNNNHSLESLHNNEETWNRILMNALRPSFQGEMPPPPPDFKEFNHGPGAGNPFAPKPIFLSDKEKDRIVGAVRREDESVVWIPVKDGEDNIGYIGAIQHKMLKNEVDKLFIRQSNIQTLWILVSAFVISFLVSVPFANRLIKPILKIQRGTRKLADGEFDVSLETDRKDEIGDLARDFNRLSETLSHNLKSRQKWVADISHELRTPVAILQGELEAMIDGVRSMTPESLDSLYQEIKRLSFIINDLYELSLSDAGALSYHMQKLDLRSLLEEYTDLTFHDIESELVFNSDEEIWINGDINRLSQAFRNLAQNTQKYTDIPGKLRIEVHKSEQNRIMIDWMDSAPGVPDTELNRIFDRLYRVESSRNRSTGGSGLGLSLVDNIVKAHGGKISSAHSPLGGLWIHIEFPEYQ